MNQKLTQNLNTSSDNYTPTFPCSLFFVYHSHSPHQPTSAIPKYDISYLPMSGLIFGSSSFSLDSFIFNAAVSYHLHLSRVTITTHSRFFFSFKNYTFALYAIYRTKKLRILFTPLFSMCRCTKHCLFCFTFTS